MSQCLLHIIIIIILLPYYYHYYNYYYYNRFIIINIIIIIIIIVIIIIIIIISKSRSSHISVSAVINHQSAHISSHNIYYQSLKKLLISCLSVFCTVRYTLYESATEYGESAYSLRSIRRHHSDKKYAKLIRSALLQLCLSVRMYSSITMRCTHLPRFRSVKENATLIELCSSTNFFGIVTITSFVNLCFSASSTSASLRCSVSCYHTTIRVFSELRLLPAFRT